MCSLGIKLQWEHGKKITYMLYDKSYKITYLLSPTNNNVMIRITSHTWNRWTTVLIIEKHVTHKNFVMVVLSISRSSKLEFLKL